MFPHFSLPTGKTRQSVFNAGRICSEFQAARMLNREAADRVAAGDNAGFWAAMAKGRSTETAND